MRFPFFKKGIPPPSLRFVGSPFWVFDCSHRPFVVRASLIRFVVWFFFVLRRNYFCFGLGSLFSVIFCDSGGKKLHDRGGCPTFFSFNRLLRLFLVFVVCGQYFSPHSFFVSE